MNASLLTIPVAVGESEMNEVQGGYPVGNVEDPGWFCSFQEILDHRRNHKLPGQYIAILNMI
jgi:hypothetical protein